VDTFTALNSRMQDARVGVWILCDGSVTKCPIAIPSPITLADHLRTAFEVNSWICRCYPMPREFFGSTGMKFEVVSPLFVPIIPTPPTGHPPALTSCYSNP